MSTSPGAASRARKRFTESEGREVTASAYRGRDRALTARNQKSTAFAPWLIRIAIAYPWGWLGSVYAVWLIAWFTLGRRPRPLLDDPKHIGGVVDFAHTTTIFCFMLAPPALFAGLLASISLRFVSKAPWRVALFWFSAVALSWILAVIYARLDPGRVVAWYVD
jgi:hypothetical protein